ncbi:uncharacterized protein LOC121778931 [Salvia splendens]|uniref:uncharacterized protein LOC121778931 n=1 Tax=Salvia splendens TaxID=180675 RepID=UPI001C27DA44|nr:uncharacterized protein LOC121778931 [Salvia splendens]
MAEFLRLQDPNRNWVAELAYFSQGRGKGSVIGATPAVAVSVTSAQPIVPIPSTVPVSPKIPQEENPLVEAELTETEERSPISQGTEPEDIEAIAAHYDSDSEERAERLREENQDREGENIVEETPVVETVRQERLAGGEGEVRSEGKGPESVDSQVKAGDDRMQVEEEGPPMETQVPETVTPSILKPPPVKRPITEKPKPTRVSQRCLGKWTASKAQTNTTENPVEIISEEEQATPKKAEIEPVQATDQEDVGVSSVQNEPGTETEWMTEGPDLASGSVSPRGSEHVKYPVPGDTTLTAQEEETQYQRARKRKGKAPLKKKSVTKKPRVANTRIVITEASQRTPPSRGERSDSEYTASEESDSDSGISLENEEYGEQSLPDDHRELVHPPVERLRYRRWTVDFTNEIAEEMKLFETQKLQDTFESFGF